MAKSFNKDNIMKRIQARAAKMKKDDPTKADKMSEWASRKTSITSAISTTTSTETKVEVKDNAINEKAYVVGRGEERTRCGGARVCVCVAMLRVAARVCVVVCLLLRVVRVSRGWPGACGRCRRSHPGVCLSSFPRPRLLVYALSTPSAVTYRFALEATTTFKNNYEKNKEGKPTDADFRRMSVSMRRKVGDLTTMTGMITAFSNNFFPKIIEMVAKVKAQKKHLEEQAKRAKGATSKTKKVESVQVRGVRGVSEGGAREGRGIERGRGGRRRGGGAPIGRQSGRAGVQGGRRGAGTKNGLHSLD